GDVVKVADVKTAAGYGVVRVVTAEVAIQITGRGIVGPDMKPQRTGVTEFQDGTHGAVIGLHPHFDRENHVRPEKVGPLRASDTGSAIKEKSLADLCWDVVSASA